jgi:hypothetical protein
MDHKEQKKLYLNINETSFYFFAIVSLIHIISGLLVVNELYVKSAWLVNRLLDVPLFIITYLYLMSAAKIHMMNKENYSKTFDLYAIIIGIIISLGLIIFDLAFSNQLPI